MLCMREANYRPKQRHLIIPKLKALLRLFKKAPTIIDLNENEDTSPALYVANHCAANGPLTYELYFPRSFVPWGTYEMCGNYAMRWKYLYHTFYQQKLGWSKLPAFVVASVFALVSRLLYSGVELIPTYPDIRFMRTIKRSLEALERGQAVLIFPEDSSGGYHEVLEEYHPGFVMLAEKYKQRTGRDIPIHSVYFSVKRNTIVIDKPVFLPHLREKLNIQGQGFSRVAAFFRDRTNALYQRYIA